MRCFWSRVFRGREELPLAQALGFLTLEIFNNLKHTEGKKKLKKHNRSSLKFIAESQCLKLMP